MGIYIKDYNIDKLLCLVTSDEADSLIRAAIEQGQVIELPTPHGRLIDGDKLYDEFAELETEASEHVRKIAGVEDLTEEWKQWSVILTERTASKHDILDTITVLESEK